MQTQSEFEQQCESVYKMAHRVGMALLVVPAQVADDMGAQVLQAVANRAGRNVITERESQYHSRTLFRPEAA